MNRKIVADLHNHSTFSDGEYTPEELISCADTLNLKTIALTDHDTLSGLNEALIAGKKNGINVIPGVEVSIRFNRSFFIGSLHVLLYFSEENLLTPDFRNELNSIISHGRGPLLIKERVDSINREFGPKGKLKILNRPITFEEVSSYGNNITRKHFALTLKEKHHIPDKHTVNMMIANNSPAYIPSGFDMSMLQPFILKYDPLCALAHPAAGSFPKPNHYKEVLPPIEAVFKLFPELLDKKKLGINGLEIHYPGHIKKHKLILLDWAKEHDLLVTGGSDCHDKSNRPLGIGGITQDELDLLIEKIN